MAKLMAATLLSKCPCKSGNKSRFRKFVHERKVFTALTAFLLEEPDQLQRSRECFISSREKCRMVRYAGRGPGRGAYRDSTTVTAPPPHPTSSTPPNPAHQSSPPADPP